MARTEKDTWDLASSVGATATMVAASVRSATARTDRRPVRRAPGSRGGHRLLHPDARRRESLDPSTRRPRGVSPPRRIGAHSLLQPDVPRRRGIRVRQAVILASGLDARAYRLPWPDGTVVYEVDQPEVIEFKSRTLAGIGAQPTASRRTVAIDLRGGLACPFGGRRLRSGAANRLGRRGAADLSAIRGPGPALRRDHRAVGAGQGLRPNALPDVRAFDNGRPHAARRRCSNSAPTSTMADLVYPGERSHVIEHLGEGWLVRLDGAVTEQRMRPTGSSSPMAS